MKMARDVRTVSSCAETVSSLKGGVGDCATVVSFYLSVGIPKLPRGRRGGGHQKGTGVKNWRIWGHRTGRHASPRVYTDIVNIVEACMIASNVSTSVQVQVKRGKQWTTPPLSIAPCGRTLGGMLVE